MTKICEACEGEGKIADPEWEYDAMLEIPFRMAKMCKACNGAGEIEVDDKQ